jgi:DNA-binding transcriptional ArsR family regulator
VTGRYRSVLSLLQDLKQGAIGIDAITIEDRRSCVAHLVAQGMTAPEIAEILRMTERTVYRDLRALRDANALHPDPAFTRELAGWVYRRAEASSARLLRLSRDPKSPPNVQVDAEAKSFEVVLGAAQTLQKLGVLPLAVAGGVEGAAGPAPSDVLAEIDRLLTCMGGAGTGAAASPAVSQLRLLRATIATVQVAVQVDVIKASLAGSMDAQAAVPPALPVPPGPSGPPG